MAWVKRSNYIAPQLGKVRFSQDTYETITMRTAKPNPVRLPNVVQKGGGNQKSVTNTHSGLGGKEYKPTLVPTSIEKKRGENWVGAMATPVQKKKRPPASNREGPSRPSPEPTRRELSLGGPIKRKKTKEDDEKGRLGGVDPSKAFE